MRNLTTSKTLSHSSCKSRKTRVRCTTQRTRSYRPQPHIRCSSQQMSMHRSTYSKLPIRANWRRKRSPTFQAKGTLIYHSRCLPLMSLQLVLACRPWKTKWRWRKKRKIGRCLSRSLTMGARPIKYRASSTVVSRPQELIITKRRSKCLVRQCLAKASSSLRSLGKPHDMCQRRSTKTGRC